MEWETRVVVLIFKKGNQRVCYWDITPLCRPSQVYARVLERRVRLVVKPQIKEE